MFTLVWNIEWVQTDKIKEFYDMIIKNQQQHVYNVPNKETHLKLKFRSQFFWVSSIAFNYCIAVDSDRKIQTQVL